MAIFSLIALTTAKQITLIRNTKTNAFEEIDLYSNTRSALSLLENDLGQAFHILTDDLGADTKLALSQNATVAHTLFDGRKSEIVFTSLSHRNYYMGRRECEQTEISYFLRSQKGGKFQTLMKRESERIDDKLYEGGNSYAILENVTSLEFQYFDPKSKKWQDAWNSDNGEFRDKFPSAVKIKIAVANEKKKDLKLETYMKIAFPNNELFLVQF